MKNFVSENALILVVGGFFLVLMIAALVTPYVVSR